MDREIDFSLFVLDIDRHMCYNRDIADTKQTEVFYETFYDGDNVSALYY